MYVCGKLSRDQTSRLPLLPVAQGKMSVCLSQVSTIFIHQSSSESGVCLAYDSDTDQIHISIMRALDKRKEMGRCISVAPDRHSGLEPALCVTTL